MNCFYYAYEYQEVKILQINTQSKNCVTWIDEEVPNVADRGGREMSSEIKDDSENHNHRLEEWKKVCSGIIGEL